MNYKELETSTHGRGFLNDGGKDKRMSEDERKLLDRAWPTEKNTAYHLGGTRYWELDFVTEPSAVSRTTIDKGKTADVSITRTTCFDVVLKNERSEARSNTPYHKRDVYGNGKNVSIEKRNASLRNVTRKRASRRKLERPVERKLKRDSQKSNYTKRSFEARGTAGFNDFRRAGDEDSITARSRKPHGVNASKPRRQIVKQTNATGKRSEKQSAKSRASQKNVNLRSVHNCLANKKNKYRKATTSSRIRKTDDEKFGGKVTHLDTVDRKSGSTSHAPHGRKIHSCFNCICDIANVVNGVRSLLSGPSFPPDEIQALRCSEYKEIQDKMVISMDSDVEEAREFPQPHYNVESLKGQRYIRLEELEDNFKSDSELDSGIPSFQKRLAKYSTSTGENKRDDARGGFSFQITMSFPCPVLISICPAIGRAISLGCRASAGRVTRGGERTGSRSSVRSPSEGDLGRQFTGPFSL